MVRIVRVVLVMGVSTVLVLTALLALGRLYRFQSTTSAGASPDSTPNPAAPPAFDAGGDASRADAIGCRPAPAGNGAFELSATVEEDGPVTVAVDLIDAQGVRHSRTVPLHPTEAGMGATVSGPADSRDCVVTGVQLGDRVIYTGR